MPGRIPRHRPAGKDASVAYRELAERKRRNRFYSSRPWRRLRAEKLEADPLCEVCDAKGVTTPARHVHHNKPVETHPDLALVWGNLQSLCVPCHNAMEVR